MSTHHLTKKIVAALAVVLLGPSLALAQANDEFQFNFSTPGARNLALGGAFLGLADDATAAYTNPAGLVQISALEVSIEVRNWAFTRDFISGGSAPGRQPTGIGIDTVEGLRYGTAEADVSDLSFFSLVYPRKKWVVALYRHKLASYRTDFETQGTFLNLEPLRRSNPLRITSNADILNLGIAAALNLGEKISIGVGLSYYDLTLDSPRERFAVRQGQFGRNDPDPASRGGQFGPPDFSRSNRAEFISSEGSDTAWGAIAGFLWQFGRSWSLGGVYRQGPIFDVDVRFQKVMGPTATGSERFIVPDLYGLGIAFQPTEALRITLDYNYVEYSQMRDADRNVVSSRTGEITGRFHRDNAGEPHLGLEYAFNMKRRLGAIALRLGTWHEPDHKRQFQGRCESLTDFFDRFGCQRREIEFPPGRDQVHYTGGMGISLRRFQVDAAFDLSDGVDTISISTVFRAGSGR